MKKVIFIVMMLVFVGAKAQEINCIESYQKATKSLLSYWGYVDLTGWGMDSYSFEATTPAGQQFLVAKTNTITGISLSRDSITVLFEYNCDCCPTDQLSSDVSVFYLGREFPISGFKIKKYSLVVRENGTVTFLGYDNTEKLTFDLTFK